MTQPILCAIPADLPLGEALEYYSSHDKAFSCGFWSSGPVVINVNYTEDEFCYLLEGRVRLVASDGLVQDFSAGDGFIIPSGFSGVWESIGTVRKFYVIYQK